MTYKKFLEVVGLGPALGLGTTLMVAMVMRAPMDAIVSIAAPAVVFALIGIAGVLVESDE